MNFIGALLAKVPLLSSAFPSRTSAAEHEPLGEGNLQWTTVDLLTSALKNIRHEIDFYTQTAEKYQLKLDPVPPSATTRDYIQLFAEAGAKEAHILEGLVLLWATEYV